MPALSPVSVDLRERAYAIHFRPLADAPALLTDAGLQPGRCLVVTDETVEALWGDALTDPLAEAGWTPHVYTLPPGEATKSAAHLAHLYDWALGLGIERRTPVLALGGGVVGDLAGYAAATLLRGLPLVQIPTTLIAQADSAIGGKTGINHAAGKNLIGAFWQPRLVLTDTETLQTLPEREWTSGLAEVVKSALIADEAFADWLDDREHAVFDRAPAVVAELVRWTAAIKARIVTEDEREAGQRALLNFGHTFGHAIERVAGYGTFTHGEAVTLGMHAALDLSRKRSPDTDFSLADRLLTLLPIPAGLDTLSTDALMAAMATDKKRRGDGLQFVALDRVGRGQMVSDVDERAVEAAWATAKNVRVST